MSYGLFILRSAQKELADLPADIYEKVKSKISALSSNPRPAGSKKLIGRPGWRIRVGKYRVIYEINDRQKMILILDIGHRRDIY